MQCREFRQGKAAPTVFFNPTTMVRCVVHGDDVTLYGYEGELWKVAAHIKGWYELKARGNLGGQLGRDEEVTMWNRRLMWKDAEIKYDADDHHVKIICGDREEVIPLHASAATTSNKEDPPPEPRRCRQVQGNHRQSQLSLAGPM